MSKSLLTHINSSEPGNCLIWELNYIAFWEFIVLTLLNSIWLQTRQIKIFLFLKSLIKMLGELYLILLLKLDIILDKLKRAIPIFFISLYIFLAIFGLKKQSQLTRFIVCDKLFILVQINLLEIGTIFMCRGNIRTYFVKTWSSYQRFYFV